jgi:isoquinoline 1-oxidoreductase beta subunit
MEANRINRRNFLRVTGITGAFLAVGFDTLALGSNRSTLKKLMAEDFVNGTPLNPFVTISTDGTITMMAHIPELGQGIFQGLPAVIAEELEVDMNQVTIVKSSASRKYGRQSIGGSRSMRTQFMPMRQLGAATKDLFIRAAAQEWGVDVGDCYAEKAKVINAKTKASLGYGELVEKASTLELNNEVKLKDKANFKIIGKATNRPDLVNKINGKADYGIDARPDGLYYATIERCPTLQGSLVSYDKEAAKGVNGVTEVMEVTRTVYGKKNTGIAVIARSQYAALEGRKLLNAKWDNEDFKKVSTTTLFNDMKALAEEEGMEHFEKGDFNNTVFTNEKVIQATYELPYLAHSCMEPMNCTVHVKKDNTVEVWASSQSPQLHRQIAQDLGIPEAKAEEKIKIHMPFMGGGFGRRSMNDAFEECYQISKEMRQPVKLVWSREDDTLQGPFRQGTVHKFTAGIDNGIPKAMQTKMVSQAITTQGRGSRGRIPFEVMESINTHYDFENMSVRFNEYQSQIPIHWWRSVFASTNGVAYEAFIDEMAVASGQDPLAFRKKYLAKEERFVKVLERLETEADWNQPLGPNEGKGMAIVESFGSIVAHALFLKKENGKVSIPKVISVVDCGIYVNPDQVKAQTEGNIIYGLTAALKDPITFKNGAAQESNFDTYRMLRMNEAPKEIEVHLIENNEAPGGVGEPGLPPIGAALLNAVANLNGQRIRKLPFDLQEI